MSGTQWHRWVYLFAATSLLLACVIGVLAFASMGGCISGGGCASAEQGPLGIGAMFVYASILFCLAPVGLLLAIVLHWRARRRSRRAALDRQATETD